jgi:PHD/YefM family antitoxin component YafN of YafNO toxin-antitoxin module
MRAISLKKFLKNPEPLLNAAEIEPVVLVREDAENLIVLPEADWRALQETIHLLNAPLNAQRLKTSLTQALEQCTLNKLSPE